ncbi:MAG: hypothetical protein IJP43_01845 [Oscillospiraceae bacterium]|nr:hypothetical protein [Oscillospiraceae bacterium]
MTEAQIKEKLDGMKKTRKLLQTVTTAASIAAILLLIAYNLLGVTFLKVSTHDTIVSAANFSEGFTFPGWQMVFWGCGGQFIMQDNLFNPNPIAIVGMVGTVLVLIVCMATYKAGKNQTKAVKEFISGAFLCYSALVLGFFIVPVAKTAVTSGGVYNFASYVNDPGSTFVPTAFAIIAGVVLLLCAAVKVYNGVFLMQQKAFAKKYAPKKGDK